MRYLVSGGGTGGHVYPALAVARALRDAQPELELAYVGGERAPGVLRRPVQDGLGDRGLVDRDLHGRCGSRSGCGSRSRT